MPWWVAVLLAVAATAGGFAIDAGSGDKELGAVFATLYALGCVAAVLAVRKSGIFTAVIQPPLLLFVAVPGAYFVFHGATFTGVKDLLINCGYPLIERFPLMLFTSSTVLLIGVGRWYFGTAGKSVADAPAGDVAGAPGRFAGLARKVSSLFGAPTADLAEDPPNRKHGVNRSATAQRRPRSGRPAKRPAPTRSRHTRPPLEDITEAEPDRPRRQNTRRRPAEYDPAAEAPRRRPRPPRDVDPQPSPPRRREQREPRERPDSHIPQRRREPRREAYPPYEPYLPREPHPPYEPPPRRRPAPGVRAQDNGTHHPVSRVRYRDPGDEL